MDTQINPAENPPEKPSDNQARKVIKYIYAVLIVVIAAGFVYGLARYYKNHHVNYSDYSIADIKSLNEADQQKALENREKEFAQQAESLPANASASDKYLACVQLAETRNELGKFQDAVSALDQIPDKKKANNRVWIAYAGAYQGLSDAQKAKESIQKALDIDDEYAPAWLLSLDINNDLPNDQLNALYLQAIAKTKSNVDVIISYAHFSEKIGNKEQAIAAWETARNSNPEKADEYNAEIARLKQ